MFVSDFGSGELGDMTVADGLINNVNSYARVVAVNANVLELDLENALLGGYEKFHAGDEIMIHATATNGTDAAMLGAFFIGKIELVDRQILTLDINLPALDLEYYYVQAITIAQFDCLTLKQGAIISPPPYNPFKYYGGILALKCFDTFKMAGGVINLVDCGIPANWQALRPITYQESAARGELDTGLLAGAENEMSDRFLVNAGDGAAYISARKIIADANSRIGNPNTYGKRNCRAAKDTAFKPSNVINIGGSSIILAAKEIEFEPALIAKYRSTDLPAGKGLARCLIAAENVPSDGKLYAADFIHNPRRLQRLHGVNNFGSGKDGALINPKTRLNNYALIDKVDKNRAHYSQKNIAALAAFNGLCLIPGDNFFVARVISDDGEWLSFDKDLPATNLIWSVPEFTDFKYSEKSHQHNFYLAAENCDLSGAKLAGDIFILAKKLTVDEVTRLYDKAVIIAEEIIGWHENILQAEGNILFVNKL